MPGQQIRTMIFAELFEITKMNNSGWGLERNVIETGR